MKGSTKEIHRNYKRYIKEIPGKHKACTKGTQREYTGNTEEIQKKYKGKLIGF